MMVSKSDLMFRHCSLDDLNAIMNLQQKICDGMKEADWFAATSREDNTAFLTSPNTIIGVFDDKKLIAFASGVFSGMDESNLAWDLEWSEEKAMKCATLDTIVVDADYRGLGLQRTLIQLCVEYFRNIMPDCTILTTICPDNIYSLRNGLSEGFEILMRKKKYGGVDRYILGLFPGGSL
ncbi:MAG: GNAT family N-acetyltransferase [Schaedlerella sp.]|nr:GNAT family N-acetyltransferase [Schaedlerella sp.]